MLVKATKYLDTQVEKLTNKLGDIILLETMAQIAKWEKKFPRYEFKIGLHDLPTFYYRKAGEDNHWQELEHYTPALHVNEDVDLVIVAQEASKFADAYCALDVRVCAPTYAFINKEGEVYD